MTQFIGLKDRICKHLWAAGLLFLLLIFMSPVRVKADITAADVDIDYTGEIAYIKQNGNTSIYFLFTVPGKTPDKFNPAGGAVGLHRFGEEECSAFMLDLSTLKTTKESSLLVCYDTSETPFRVDIPAQVKLKGEYTGIEREAGEFERLYSKLPGFSLETGYFTLTADDKEVTDLTKLRWKAGASTNYRDMSELNMEIYTGAGATLYFQYADGKTPLSKAVKVKIKKPGNPPKIKVDGAKQTIAIKSNMQYRVVTSNYEGYWITPDTGTTSLKISELVGLSGDGLYTPFEDAVVEVRVAATEKAHCSRTGFVYLDAVEEPVFGAEGITVGFTKGTDDKNGLSITNNSEEDYQVAVVEKGAWGTKSIKELILKVDGSAKKGSDGAVAWKKAGAGKTVKISYKDYKDFDSYLILARKATVKEDTKTAAREFRVASVIRPFGGVAPTPDIRPGTYAIDAAKEVTITFAEEAGFTLYTSLQSDPYAKNETGKVSFTAEVGMIYAIKAYFEDDSTKEKSDEVSFVYRYVGKGELPDYKDAWGYNYYIKLDKKLNNGDNYAELYRRIYLGFLTYEPNVDYSDLKIDKDQLSKIVCSVWADNPQLIQAKTGLRYTSTRLILNIYNEELCERLYAQCEDSYSEIKGIIDQKYGSIENASKIQIVKEIHDYLVLKKEYASSAMSQTMAGSLSDEYTPVCMSYTLAMKWCCNRLGVQCEIIFGYTNKEAHAWNIINYGENVDYSSEYTIDPTKWYEMDVTWDDPVGGNAEYIGRTYYNVTTAFINTSRRRVEDYYPAYPVDECTGTDYSWSNIKSQFQ